MDFLLKRTFKVDFPYLDESDCFARISSAISKSGIAIKQNWERKEKPVIIKKSILKVDNSKMNPVIKLPSIYDDNITTQKMLE